MVDFRIVEAIDGVYVGEGAEKSTGERHPLLWDHGTVTKIGSPGNVQAVAMDVNAGGTVVGFDLYNYIPYIWESGTAEHLAVPPGSTNTTANAINDAGTIVGSTTIDGVSHGIVWSADQPDSYQDLGTGDGFLQLTDISNTGTITADTSKDQYWDVRRGLKGSVLEGFHPLAGLNPAKNSTAAEADGTYVLGSGTLSRTSRDAKILWQGDTPTALPAGFLPLGINDNGLAAGTRDPSSRTEPPVVWADGTLTSLPGYMAGGWNAAWGVTSDGTVFGMSQSAPVGNGSGDPIPVIWTCS